MLNHEVTFAISKRARGNFRLHVRLLTPMERGLTSNKIQSLLLAVSRRLARSWASGRPELTPQVSLTAESEAIHSSLQATMQQLNGVELRIMEATVKMMKAKIHRAKVTESDLQYEGSIGIDSDLLTLSGILPFEAVHVWNVNTGHRWETYAIPLAAASKTIQVNGAAARLAQVGDILIIAAFSWMPASSAQHHAPSLLLLDDSNSPMSRQS